MIVRYASFGAALCLMLLVPAAGSAATIDVAPGVTGIAGGDGCGFAEAIINANEDAQTHADCVAGSGTDVVRLASGSTYLFTTALTVDPFGNTALPVINEPLRIDGRGATLTRDTSVPCTHDQVPVPGEFRFLYGRARTFTVEDVLMSSGCTDSQPGFSNAGGAIFAENGLVLRRVTFIGNRAQSGGGAVEAARAADSSLVTEFHGTAFVGNVSALGRGGGASVSNGRLTVSGCTFDGNVALIGGALMTPFVSSTIGETLFVGNHADRGGALYAFTGANALRNVTFESNYATGPVGGGALLAQSPGTVSVSFSTFSANSGTGGGIRSDSGGRVAIRASVFVDSTCAKSTSAQFSSLGDNYETGLSCGGFTGGGFASVSSAQIALQPLASGLGPTRVMPIGAASVLRDAAVTCADANGVLVTTDQRGRDRPGGGLCDVGAFELDGPDDLFRTGFDSPFDF